MKVGAIWRPEISHHIIDYGRRFETNHCILSQWASVCFQTRPEFSCCNRIYPIQPNEKASLPWGSIYEGPAWLINITIDAGLKGFIPLEWEDSAADLSRFHTLSCSTFITGAGFFVSIAKSSAEEKPFKEHYWTTYSKDLDFVRGPMAMSKLAVYRNREKR